VPNTTHTNLPNQSSLRARSRGGFGLVSLDDNGVVDSTDNCVAGLHNAPPHLSDTDADADEPDDSEDTDTGEQDASSGAEGHMLISILTIRIRGGEAGATKSS